MMASCNSLEVEDLVDRSIALWSANELRPAALGRYFDPSEQIERERNFDRFVALLDSEARRLPRTAGQRRRALTRISEAFAELAQTALDVDESCLSLLLDDGFSGIGTKLARQAREFDPRISFGDIMQACRNAWTACGLQALFGRPMSLNRALFAYSLLYPYSDNFMDDSGAAAGEKLSFSARFGRRLAGEHVPSTDSRELAVFRLVSLIEAQYPRSDFPGVYESLLAIHSAQEGSLAQVRPARQLAERDLIRLTCRKGGTSVLADAYLGTGELQAHEIEFAFYWGVFLQFADDLQDLQGDLVKGSQTLFSRAAGHEPLDLLTCGTLSLGQQVGVLMEGLPASSDSLKRLLRASSVSLIIRAAGCLPHLYSPGFLDQLECYSPFRFAFLRDRQGLFARSKGRVSLLFEALIASGAEESIFPSLSLQRISQ